MANPEYRHCNTKECPEHYKQGKQVACGLYELDLLHGRDRLTTLEVQEGQTKPGEECRYQLPPHAQTQAKSPEQVNYEMAERAIRAFNAPRTSTGPIDSWKPLEKASIDFCRQGLTRMRRSIGASHKHHRTLSAEAYSAVSQLASLTDGNALTDGAGY